MGRNVRPIAVLFVTLFLVMIGFGVVIPIFPFLIMELGGGPATLGFFMASFSVMQFIFAPLWGRLVKRFGDVKLIKAGMLISSVGMLLILMAPNVILLFLTSAIFNIGVTLLGPSSSSLVSKNSSGGQGAALGLMQSFGSLGRIFGKSNRQV